MPTPAREAAFLNEQGITITRTQITAGGKNYRFANLANAHVERTRPTLMQRLLKKMRPTFRLIVVEKASTFPQCVFETPDPAFADRISQAMGKAAKANTGQRTR